MVERGVATPVRIMLGLLVASGATVGLFAGFAPRAFYDHFPGLGQTWVAVDGPYNEHLVRDVGTLNLALAVVTLCALVSLSRPTILAAALGWLAYGVPHFVYHLRHLAPFDGGEAVAVMSSLASAPILALVALWLARPVPAGAPAPPAVAEEDGRSGRGMR